MALIISSVNIRNTNISIENAYARISFNAFANGKASSVNLALFVDKSEYLLNKNIITDIESSFIVECLETETQTIEVIHQKAKSYLEEKGYTVTIDF